MASVTLRAESYKDWLSNVQDILENKDNKKRGETLIWKRYFHPKQHPPHPLSKCLLLYLIFSSFLIFSSVYSFSISLFNRKWGHNPHTWIQSYILTMCCSLWMCVFYFKNILVRLSGQVWKSSTAWWSRQKQSCSHKPASWISYALLPQRLIKLLWWHNSFWMGRGRRGTTKTDLTCVQSHFGLTGYCVTALLFTLFVPQTA